MNQRDLQTKRNNTRRLFEHTSGIHINCIRINTGNTFEHELAKFIVCWHLAKYGNEDFITEAVFEDRKLGRADVVALDRGSIIEICMTETERSLAMKAKKYPLNFETRNAPDIIKSIKDPPPEKTSAGKYGLGGRGNEGLD